MIPIKVKPDKSVENVKLFEDYIVRYNKSYKNDTQKYNQRFECFQVNEKSICQISNSCITIIFKFLSCLFV